MTLAPTWRSGWDSNPRAIARKLISSQPRYDHFDTSPYMLTRLSKVNAYLVFVRIPLRTRDFLMLSHRRKTAPLKAFRRFCFFHAKKISSQARYDHFDNSPYIFGLKFIFSEDRTSGQNNLCIQFSNSENPL